MMLRRFPNLEVVTVGVSGSVDVIGDGSRGDLANVVGRIRNLGRRRADVTMRLAARRDDGGREQLEPVADTRLTVAGRSERELGVQFYLPAQSWDSEPFEPELVDTRSGRSLRLPYAGRTRSRT